jgi:hypothetical protein
VKSSMENPAGLTQRLNADGANRRINRWIESLMPFGVTIQWVAGEANPADSPSRRWDYERRKDMEETRRVCNHTLLSHDRKETG